MAVLKYDGTPAEKIREGAQRRVGHTGNLMIAVIDFYDGPKAQPDPPHSHPHEQISYVAEGEILLLRTGLMAQAQRLGNREEQHYDKTHSSSSTVHDQSVHPDCR